jgi:hypothetical protein
MRHYNDINFNETEYYVNIISDRSIKNQIKIEIFAKNLKSTNRDDIKLRIESELVTTVYEDNLKLNKHKKTIIRTKMLPSPLVTKQSKETEKIKKIFKRSFEEKDNEITSKDINGFKKLKVSSKTNKIYTNNKYESKLLNNIHKRYILQLGFKNYTYLKIVLLIFYIKIMKNRS